MLFIKKFKNVKKKGRCRGKEWEAQEYHSGTLPLSNSIYLYIRLGPRKISKKGIFYCPVSFFCLIYNTYLNYIWHLFKVLCLTPKLEIRWGAGTQVSIVQVKSLSGQLLKNRPHDIANNKMFSQLLGKKL